MQCESELGNNYFAWEGLLAAVQETAPASGALTPCPRRVAVARVESLQGVWSRPAPNADGVGASHSARGGRAPLPRSVASPHAEEHARVRVHPHQQLHQNGRAARRERVWIPV